METFSALLVLCAGNSPAGDLRRHRVHYDVIVMRSLQRHCSWSIETGTVTLLYGHVFRIPFILVMVFRLVGAKSWPEQCCLICKWNIKNKIHYDWDTFFLSRDDTGNGVYVTIFISSGLSILLTRVLIRWPDWWRYLAGCCRQISTWLRGNSFCCLWWVSCVCLPEM